MGLMKEHLMKKITEFAKKVGIDEEAIYKDDFLYSMATEYAERGLQRNMNRILEAIKESNNGN